MFLSVRFHWFRIVTLAGITHACDDGIMTYCQPCCWRVCSLAIILFVPSNRRSSQHGCNGLSQSHLQLAEREKILVGDRSKGYRRCRINIRGSVEKMTSHSRLYLRSNSPSDVVLISFWSLCISERNCIIWCHSKILTDVRAVASTSHLLREQHRCQS